jgi:type I restriction-modification system DNA methylase subunit
MNPKTLDLPTLESWLWDAACSIRGAIDASRYKEYILPLLFYKRLSDVYADEIARITREIGDADLARELADYVLCRGLLHGKVASHTSGWVLLMGMHLRNWRERERQPVAWMSREQEDGSQ